MLYDYYPLIAALSANGLAQILKPFALYTKTKKFDKYQFIAAGGFPSSHTSTVTGLALSIGLKEGFDSSLFFISFILLIIVAYDAMNVRLYAGRHIELTHQLIDDLRSLENVRFDDPIYFKKMKKILGHERFEVFGGLILGIIVSIIFYYILGGN